MRKPVIVAAAAMALCASMHGQTSGTFTIGPRYSNYATTIDAGVPSLKTGRQNAIGLVGGYRTGSFVLDFQYDYDPTNGIGVSNLIADFGDYQRTRGEVTVGVSPIRGFDIHAGGRWESVRIGGASIFGNPVATDLNIDHQAIVVGGRVQTDSWKPFGWYLLGRGYIGSAKFDRFGVRVNSDTSGYRAETAVPVASASRPGSSFPASSTSACARRTRWFAGPRTASSSTSFTAPAAKTRRAASRLPFRMNAGR